MFYAVYEKDNGALMSTGSIVADPLPDHLAVKEIDGPPVNGWNPETLAFDISPPVQAPTLRRVDFMRRFTVDERVAIRTSDNAYVVDLHEMTMAADTVTLDDAELVAGVELLETLGIIEAGRAQEVLDYGD